MKGIALVAQVFSASFTSGLAGVYFEKLIKGGTQSVWTRNFFLAIFSLGFGCVNVLLQAHEFERSHGFVAGFDKLVLLLVCANAVGGMIVGMVMKYADNILKGFAVRLHQLTPTQRSKMLTLLSGFGCAVVSRQAYQPCSL